MNPYLQQILHDITERLTKLEEASKREWAELTDEEIETLIHRFDGDPHTLLDEVNARLKRKNT